MTSSTLAAAERAPAGRFRRWVATTVGVGRSYLGHAELVWRSAPAAVIAALSLTLVGAAASTAGIVLLGKVVGAATAAADGSGDLEQGLRWMAWLAVSFLIPPVSGAAVSVLSQHIMSAAVARVGALTSEFASAPDGIEQLEDPTAARRLHRMVQAIGEWTYLEGIGATWTVLQTRLSGIGAFAVIADWHWWAAVLLAIGYLTTGRALTAWLLAIFADMALEPPMQRRRASYLFDVLMKGNAAKEIRLFGLPQWMIERYGRLWQQAMVDVWRRRNRTIRPVIATTVVMLLCAVAFYGVLGWETWTGIVPAGTATALVGASMGLQAIGMLGDEQVLCTQAIATTDRLRRARIEVGLPGLSPAPDPTPRPAPVADDQPTRPARIRIEDLHFGYPSRQTPIFSGLDLEVPAGQSIAIVGVNGAGKSTLIKLLCGLYRPDAGSIRIDDAAPAADRRARERVAVIFQDFVRYQLSLKENVALGARGAPDTEAVVSRSLHDAAGDDILDRLGGNWDTVLSGEYRGGTDLSGGQWQRVALARALAAIAGGSGVLVLDEPTAALDVRAEAHLFDRFLEVTRGMTTVLVSHRLSSVRHADRIVVIDNGRIVEDGSHDQLLERGGRYADMFTLQASRFVAASGADATDNEELPC
ncbi:ABC transporter ATP-binding protein [Microlunatus soli]|uniref:ATP-binding cassette, subfamily B n=1 Tax=Microlunatus soli TaxID=630515 RepID=A0A1H1ZHN6_9ACTN|nr:ABC transporter ATP-binding protein [Microlunatus soli]SDT33204.1 ATP-binding cassette, subfamily B [Microlunatus soli]